MKNKMKIKLRTIFTSALLFSFLTFTAFFALSFISQTINPTAIHAFAQQDQEDTGDRVRGELGLDPLDRKEAEAVEFSTCDDRVQKVLLGKVNNAAQEEKAKVENAFESDKQISVLGMTCFSEDIKRIYEKKDKVWGALKKLKAIGPLLNSVFSGELEVDWKQVGQEAVKFAEEQIENFDVGGFVCNKAKDWLKKQRQCFNFSDTFSLDIPKLDFDFDKCLIRADFSISERGFSYAVSPGLINVNAQGGKSFGLQDEIYRWGNKSQKFLDEFGVGRLLSPNEDTFMRADGTTVDVKVWDPAKATPARRMLGRVCGPLDPDYDTDKIYSILDACPATSPTCYGLAIEHDPNQTGPDAAEFNFTWKPKAGLRCEEEKYDADGNIVAEKTECETNLECYDLYVSMTPPFGTCYMSDQTGAIVKNSQGFPVTILPESVKKMDEEDAPLPPDALNNCNNEPSYTGTDASRQSLASLLKNSSKRYICDNNLAQDVCGIDIDTSCCDPSARQCDDTFLDICLCRYKEAEPEQIALNTTMWTKQGDQDWYCTGNSDVPPEDLQRNCCDPEFNDCESDNFPEAMIECPDPEKMCVDFTKARQNGNTTYNREYDASSGIPFAMSDLFSIYHYLSIKPDNSVPLVMPQEEGPLAGHAPEADWKLYEVPGTGEDYYVYEDSTTGEELPSIPQACCTTDWCNICPHNVLAAYQLRAMGYSPSVVGVHNNEFLNGFRAHVPDGLKGDKAYIWEKTGNIYMWGPRDIMAIPEEIAQPNKEYCMGSRNERQSNDKLPEYISVSNDRLACNLINNPTSYWMTMNVMFDFWQCVAKKDASFRDAFLVFIGEGSDYCDFESPYAGLTNYCKDVKPLPYNAFAIHPDIIREEGLPIGSVKHAPDYKGPQPYPLCRELNYCKVTEKEAKSLALGGDGEQTPDEIWRELMEHNDIQEVMKCAEHCSIGGFYANPQTNCVNWRNAIGIDGMEIPSDGGSCVVDTLGCEHAAAVNTKKSLQRDKTRATLKCAANSLSAIGSNITSQECGRFCDINPYSIVCQSCVSRLGCSSCVAVQMRETELADNGYIKISDDNDRLGYAMYYDYVKLSPDKQVECNICLKNRGIKDEIDWDASDNDLQDELQRNLRDLDPRDPSSGGGGSVRRERDEERQDYDDGGSSRRRLEQPKAPETPQWQQQQQQQPQQRRAPSLPTTRQPRNNDGGGGILQKLF